MSFDDLRISIREHCSERRINACSSLPVRSHDVQINHLISNYTGIVLKSTIESINSRTDFKVYRQNYAYALCRDAPRGPGRDSLVEDFGFVRHPRFLFGSPTNLVASYHHCRPSGLVHVLLFTQIPRSEMVKAPLQIGSANIWRRPQMARDNVDLPVILEKCCVVTVLLLRSMTSVLKASKWQARKVVSLKECLDKGPLLGIFFSSLV